MGTSQFRQNRDRRRWAEFVTPARGSAGWLREGSRMAEMAWEHAAEGWAAVGAIVSDTEQGGAALPRPLTIPNLPNDRLPDAPREKSLLVAAAEAGLADTLREHVAHGMDSGTAIRLTASSFSVRTPLTPEACRWVTGEIAMALGIGQINDAGYSPGPAVAPPGPTVPAPGQGAPHKAGSYGHTSGAGPAAAAPGAAGYPPAAAGYSPGAAGFSPGSGGYPPGSAGYSPGAPGYRPGPAGYSPGAAGYSPGAAGYSPGAAGYSPEYPS